MDRARSLHIAGIKECRKLVVESYGGRIGGNGMHKHDWHRRLFKASLDHLSRFMTMNRLLC